MVASAFCSFTTSSLVVDGLVMSCRVLHRGVEQRLLQQLAETALARGKAQVLVRSGKGTIFYGGATKMVVVPGNV